MQTMKTSYQNLQDFITALEQAGELHRIIAPVSHDLEITHITDLACKCPGGGKALLFENVVGSDFPVLTNAYGSDRRICMSLGVPDLETLAGRLRQFIQMEPPKRLRDALRLLPMGMELLKSLPRKVKTAPCQEVIHMGKDIDLGRIPVLKCWPLDGGPFVTFPVVITRSLETHRRNAGMYRLQVFDRRTTGMHWHIHKDGSHYFQEYRKAGRRMPVAVAIGTDPATTYAATAPLPRGIDEMMLAGFIRRRPVPMTRCVTIDLEVPAEAEFVLEGYVDPDEMRIEGPFGDHTGYYSLVGDYPVFHLTAVTHRRRPVYSATIVGKPPMEDCYLARATERVFLPLMNAVLPEVKDFWLPWEGVFHNLSVISIAKEYPGHARRIMSAVWGQGQMSFCKAVVLVDDSMDLSQPGAILREVLNRIDLRKDVTITEGVLDVLDHSAPEPLFGGKLGVDATRRMPGESPRGEAAGPSHLPSGASIREALRTASELLTDHHILPVEARNRVLLVSFKKDGSSSAQYFRDALLAQPLLEPFTIIVLCDDFVDLTDYAVVLWKACNNVDPRRDMALKEGRIVIDATRKGPEDGHHREWPEDILMDPEIVEQVRKRAGELGIDTWGTVKAS